MRSSARRLLLVISSLAFALIGRPIGTSGHTYYCGWSPLQTQLILYEDANLQHIRGEDCNSDGDYTNGIDGTSSNVNDVMTSVSLTGIAGQTWCVYLYEETAAQGYGDYLIYRVHNGQDRHILLLPTGWGDRVSAHSQLKVTYNGTCPT